MFQKVMLNRRYVLQIVAQALLLSVALRPLAAHPQGALKPLSKDDVVRLLKGDVLSKRVAEMARQRGIGFELTPAVESELRQAGATDELLAALRELAPKPAVVVVETSPVAQVYLDDVFKGQASAQGHLVIDDAKPGDRTLRVSLAGKKDFEQQVTVVAGQVAKIQAALPDLAGSIRVQTSPGAVLYVDRWPGGRADTDGHLFVRDVPAGNHRLRITAAGKQEWTKEIEVAPGKMADVAAVLTDSSGQSLPLPPPPPPPRVVNVPAANTPPLPQPASYEVFHNHSLGGSCMGTLTITSTTVDYTSRDKHGHRFSIPLSSIKDVKLDHGILGLGVYAEVTTGMHDFKVRQKDRHAMSFTTESTNVVKALQLAVSRSSGR